MESEVLEKGVASEGVRSPTPGDPLWVTFSANNPSYCMNCSSLELQNRTMTHTMGLPLLVLARVLEKSPPGDLKQIPQKNG